MRLRMSPENEPSSMNEHKLNILLIEDDPDDAFLITEMVHKSTGNETITRADRLSSALSLIHERHFDIALLDLGLPDSYALQSLQAIQAKAPTLPIIIFTGDSDEKTIADALSLGAQDYLVKGDFGPKLLERSIHYAVQRKQAQEALERAHDQLQLCVLERTSELTIANAELTAEIAERKITAEELIRSNEQMRELAAHLQTIREEERTNIAREIHDELGQIMTALKMDLFWISQRLQDNQLLLAEKIRGDIQLVENTIASVRRLCTELRPSLLDSLGLQAALEWQCEEFQKRTGIKCRLDVYAEESVTDEDMKTAIFRIFQEILTNIMRHAHASNVDSVLTMMDDSIVLRVCDNGIGISNEQMAKANSFGLLGMRERVSPWKGRVEIKGTKGLGTTVSAIIPINKKR